MEIDFEKYADYVDQVWNRKNNKQAFIIMHDDQFLNKNMVVLDIFDIMTMTQNM